MRGRVRAGDRTSLEWYGFGDLTPELLYEVWEYRAPARTRTLDSHASRLRRKLREAGPGQSLVENVWGVGYRLLGELPEM